MGKRGPKPLSKIIDGQKVCTKCGIDQPISEYRINRHRLPDCLRSQCKECESIKQKGRGKTGKLRHELYKPYNCKYKSSEYYEESKRREYEKQGKIYIGRKEKEKLQLEKLATKPPPKQNYCLDCDAIISNRSKRCRDHAHTHDVKKKIERQTELYHTDPHYRINHRMRSAIGRNLRGEKCGRHWFGLVGWDLNDLIMHIGKQLKPPMTWENYGSVWHIDHKIPIAAFNFKKAEDIDFKKAWSLKNLQPLFAFDNLSKSDRLVKPHQPSLSLSL